MGHWQKQTELWVEPIDLGRRIAKDRLLRKINRALDLSFVRAEANASCNSVIEVVVRREVNKLDEQEEEQEPGGEEVGIRSRADASLSA